MKQLRKFPHDLVMMFIGLAMLTHGALSQTPPPVIQSAERDLLLNSDFSLIGADGNPTAWFRAMIPAKTTNLQAGVKKESDANVLYLSQDGTLGLLFNNWAQRIENPPVGAALRVEADVAAERATGKGGVVMLMFFDAAGNITGAASSEGRENLTDTRPWTKIMLEAVVPPRTTTAIMRIGLSAGSAGMIKARSCRVIQSGAITPGAAAGDGAEQILVNSDFDQGELNGSPIGWFRAMIPGKTTNLDAGIARDDKGPYIFLSQDGTSGPLFNNWAQNVEPAPRPGVHLRLEAEVATRDIKRGAVVMVMFFGADDRVVSTITTEGRADLTGSKGLTKISAEGIVPPGTKTAIVRCGIISGGSGAFYIRTVKLWKMRE